MAAEQQPPERVTEEWANADLEDWKNRAFHCVDCDTYWNKTVGHVPSSYECLEMQDSIHVEFKEGEDGTFR